MAHTELHPDNSDINNMTNETNQVRPARPVPLVPLPGMVLMPHMMAAVKVSDERALAAIRLAENGERLLLLAPAPEQADTDEAMHRAIYDDDGRPVLSGNIGVVARIEQITVKDDGSQVALQGLYRMRIDAMDTEEGVIVANGVEWKDAPMEGEPAPEVAELLEKCYGLLEHMISLMPGIPEGVVNMLRQIRHPGHLADQTGYFPEYEFSERLALLNERDAVTRLRTALAMLKKHAARLQIRADIIAEVKDEIDSDQREVFLREQLRVIQRELGEDDDDWLGDLRKRLEDANLPSDVRKKADRELARLDRMGPHSPESSIIQTYLEWIADLPWQHSTQDTNDLAKAARTLDADHYGLTEVKERILEFLAVRTLAGEKLKAPILCFVGPPGVGKTSLGRSIAKVLGRKFVRISLGGLHDEAEIRGHRRTYIGAMPGRIIQGMRDANTCNPVFMLDEIDKVGRDFRGDPTAALLEALDPEQNNSFSDHFLEVPFDLSQTIFITTANLLDPIPAALRDRMEVIRISGYTEEEKLAIARQFLVPKQVEAHGLTAREIVWRDEALLRVVREYTHEAGVRNLEREIASVTRKVARKVVEQSGERNRRHVIGGKNLETFLGPPRYEFGMRESSDQVGVATGVAVTEAGGEVLPVEVSIVAGSGKLLLTGQLGDVMRESAQAALTYARSALAELGSVDVPLDKRDVHIHVPAGGVPKDGPSAGIAMATALLSALSGRAVRRDVAMTGEVTLRGRVLPIGGLKEKVLAAKAAGITQFILPAQNQKDLPELSGSARHGINLIPVEHMNQVLSVALQPSSPPRQSASA